MDTKSKSKPDHTIVSHIMGIMVGVALGLNLRAPDWVSAALLIGSFVVLFFGVYWRKHDNAPPAQE